MFACPWRDGSRRDHQENPSAIIAGCGVYNWAANCNPVVTTAIWLESVCSSAGRLRPDHTKYELGLNSARSRVGSFRDFSSSDRVSLLPLSHHHLLPSPPYSSTFPVTVSHSLQHSPVMWTHCCLSLHVNLQVRTVCGCPVGIVLLPTCGIWVGELWVWEVYFTSGGYWLSSGHLYYVVLLVWIYCISLFYFVTGTQVRMGDMIIEL